MASEGTIARFPEELLLLIFTYLQPTLKVKSWKPCSEKVTALCQSLARVCRVNKICRRIATPLLYRDVELPGAADIPDWKRYKCNVKLFFRTILEDPSLAQLVRRLKVEYHGSSETSNQICDDRRIDVLRPAVCALLRTLPLSDESQNRITMRALVHYDDAMLAILIPLCSNLDYLDLTIFEHPHNLTGSPLMRTVDEIVNSVEGTNYFSRLETIKLRQSHAAPSLEEEPSFQPSEGFRLIDVNALLRLPALKNVRCRSVGGREWIPFRDASDLTAPILSSSIVSMHLTSSIVSAKEIAEALRALPSLREFKFTEREASFLDLDHGEVFDALRLHGRKLKVLQFHACNVGGPPGDLKPLTRLKELSIAQRSLLGSYDPNIAPEDIPELTDVLPEALTKVKIIPFRRSYPLADFFAPLQPEDDWDNPRHALTDFGKVFDERVVRLCRDAKFEKLGKVTLRRSDDIEAGLVPQGWAPEVDEAGWVRLRRVRDVVIVDPKEMPSMLVGFKSLDLATCEVAAAE